MSRVNTSLTSNIFNSNIKRTVRSHANSIDSINSGVSSITTTLSQHIENNSNPHTVTATQLGLGPSSDVSFNSLNLTGNLTTTGLIDSVDLAQLKSDYDSHAANTSNPHSVSRAQLNLDTDDSPQFVNLTLSSALITTYIESDSSTGSLYVSGGSSSALGSRIELHGESHVSLAKDMWLYADEYVFRNHDNDTTAMTLTTGGLTVNAPLSCDTSLTIDAVSIGATALEFCNDIDQPLTKGSTPSFAGLNVNGTLTCDTSLTIDTVSIGATALEFANDLNQQLTTTSSPTFGGLTISGTITSGLINSVDLAALNTQVQNLQTELDAHDDNLQGLTDTEILQLHNINTTTISTAQWGYLGNLDQDLITSSSPTFVNLTLSSALITSYIESNSPTGEVYISGGSSSALGGRMTYYGESHGTWANGVHMLTNDFQLLDINSNALFRQTTSASTIFKPLSIIGTLTCSTSLTIDSVSITSATLEYCNDIDQQLTSTSNVSFNKISMDNTGDSIGIQASPGASPTYESALATFGGGINSGLRTMVLDNGWQNSLNYLEGNPLTIYSRGVIKAAISYKGNACFGAPTHTIMDLAQLVSNSTTSQLALTYDASNYCLFTVDSAGDLTIAPTGNQVILDMDAIGGGENLIMRATNASDIGIQFETKTNQDWQIFARDSSSELIIGRAGAGDWVKFSSGGYMGIGVSPSTPLHVRSTASNQARIDYDASNYSTLAVSSGGNLTISPTGSEIDLNATQVKINGVSPFHVGIVTTPTSTGNQSITGVGFKPQMLVFTLLTNATSGPSIMNGYTDQSGNEHCACSEGVRSGYSTTSCIYWEKAGGTVRLQASHVSMDSDGFTINWATVDTISYAVGYQAYA